MVFCSKVLMESPKRSMWTSPRRTPSCGRYASNFTLQMEEDLSLIPEREWRLLTALVRKKEAVLERERLAKEFKKAWNKQKEENEMICAEATAQYRRYLQQKRDNERSYQEYRRNEKVAEMNARRDALINTIRHKEMRSADLLAAVEDTRITQTLGKAVLEQLKAESAAQKRTRRGATEELSRQLLVLAGQKKVDVARERRNSRLRESSERLAVNRALNEWEVTLIRQDLEVDEIVRRSRAASRSFRTQERCQQICSSRAEKAQRAKRVAAITAQIRALIMEE